MSRAPRLSGGELIAALERAGFAAIRIRGSHHFMRHEDGRATVVPVHSSETIGPGLLHKILRDCKLTVELLQTLLHPWSYAAGAAEVNSWTEWGQLFTAAHAWTEVVILFNASEYPSKACGSQLFRYTLR